MRPLAPFSLFIVGGKVLKALDFVLLLCKLAFNFLFLGLQFLNFFFVHDFNLLTVKVGCKKTAYVWVDGLCDDMGFSDFAVGIVCVSRLFPLQSALG